MQALAVGLKMLQKFGLDHFKEKQSLAMKELTLGRDAFVILPTGSGKSLIFQAFILVCEICDPRSVLST